MSPPTDVSGVRSSREAIADAIVLALGLQVQAMLTERKAVERVLGCDAGETVLDAATRVAGDLASAEKQIDDVRDILKAKVGELTVDAATHAIVLAQNHATLVKQVEQMERMLKEKDKENAEFKTCWHEMGVILGCIVQVLLLPPGNGDAEVRSWEAPGGPELMLEAARRVVKERDEARRDLASAREASASWQKERNDARRRLKVEREHSTASDCHLVETHKALGGRTGVEHVTEAAKRVAQERDAYRIRVKDMESNVCKLSAERDEAKALAVTLAKERDEALATIREFDMTPPVESAAKLRAKLHELNAKMESERVVLEAKFGETTVDAARRVVAERDDARALCVAVAAELYALPDEPVLAAAKRVAQDLRDEVGEARQARRDRDKALAELNAVRRILPPMNDRETTVDAAKRVAERRDEARADAGRMMKDLDDVRTVLEAKFSETTVDAARRVVAAAHNVDVAAREEAISDLEQKVAEKEADANLTTLGLQEARRDASQKQRAFDEDMSAILAALGARPGEKAVDVAKRVVKERDSLHDAFQTVSHCQQATARSFLSLAETLGVSPSDAASRVNSIIAREEEFRLAVAAYAQQDEELREILLAGPTERTLEAVRRMAKAYEDTRKESILLRNDLENIRKMTKAPNGECANAAVWRILHVALQHDQAREALAPQSAAETTVEAAKRVVTERDAARTSSCAFASIVSSVSATLGAGEDEDAVTAAKRVVKERYDLRDELDKRMSL